MFVGVVVSRLCGAQACRCAGVRKKIRQLAACGKVDKLTRILWKLNSPARLSKGVVRRDIEKHVRGTDPFVTCDRATEIHDAVVAGQAIARVQLVYEYASSAGDSEKVDRSLVSVLGSYSGELKRWNAKVSGSWIVANEWTGALLLGGPLWVVAVRCFKSVKSLVGGGTRSKGMEELLT